MLRSFLDAHSAALSCLASLHGQLSSSEAHILALNRELSAACQREEEFSAPASGQTTEQLVAQVREESTYC